jgi:hypothetical protein
MRRVRFCFEFVTDQIRPASKEARDSLTHADVAELNRRTSLENGELAICGNWTMKAGYRQEFETTNEFMRIKF